MEQNAEASSPALHPTAQWGSTTFSRSLSEATVRHHSRWPDRSGSVFTIVCTYLPEMFSNEHRLG